MVNTADAPGVTIIVIGTVCVPNDETIVIVPLQVVPAPNARLIYRKREGRAERTGGEAARWGQRQPVALVQLCSDTWVVASVFVCANTVSVCEAGAVPPAAAVNV